jgi:uncharacterized delta-60 repeat protein
MRIQVSPTPSNTPSYTPTNTPTSTECPLGCFSAFGASGNIRGLFINPITGNLTLTGQISGFAGFSDIRDVLKLKKTGFIDTSFVYDYVTGVERRGNSVIELDNQQVLYTVTNGNITIRKLLATGELDTSFTELGTQLTGITSPARSFGFDIQNDGKIVVGGSWNVVSGNSYSKICRLNANGTLDTSFNVGTGFNSTVVAVKIQPDGKILCAGNFITYSGVSSNGIIRLNTDGSVDTSFNFTGSTGTKNALLLLPTGKIIIQNFNQIVRLNSDGSIDNTFNAALLNGVSVDSYDLDPTNNGILMAGQFDGVNSIPSKGLVKLFSDGTVDPSLNVGTGFGIVSFLFPNVVKRKYNGNLYVGGNYDQYNGDTSIASFTELLPTGEVFECAEQPCTLFSQTLSSGSTSGTTYIVDCLGKLRQLLIADTVPQFFCAQQIVSNVNTVISGGTQLATDCCFGFQNIGPTNRTVRYLNCGNGNVLETITPGQSFCAKYVYSGTLKYFLPNYTNIRQLENCPPPSPSPTQTPTRTPTATPSITPTNTQTNTPSPTCACVKYELSTSFTNPVYTYTDCDGTIRNIQIGFFSTFDICSLDVPTGGFSTFLGCCDVVPTPPPTNTQTRTPTNTPTNTQTNTPTASIGATPTNTSTPSATPTLTPTNTITSTPTETIVATPTTTTTMTPTPSATPTCDCLCYTTTYETIPEDLQVRWRDCETGTITTQDISTLLQRDNNDGTFTSFLCVEQGSSYETPICVLDGMEVTCDPLTWIENGPCCDSIDCDIPLELCITIPTNGSLDITITDVYVNGIQATPIGTWPNTPGNGANLTVALPAGTYSVEIFHSASVSGQKVSVIGSDSTLQCSPVSTGSSSTTFSSVAMDNIQCLEILVEDGAC